MLKYKHKEQKTMFKRKVKFDVAKIEQKLNAGDKPQRMYVYTVEKTAKDRVFVESGYQKLKMQADEQQVKYFCKMLEGCGFNR